MSAITDIQWTDLLCTRCGQTAHPIGKAGLTPTRRVRIEGDMFHPRIPDDAVDITHRCLGQQSDQEPIEADVLLAGVTTGLRVADQIPEPKHHSGWPDVQEGRD